MGRGRGRGSRKRGRWTEADAQSFLAGWRKSGVSLAAHCRARGVSYERVRRWRTKLEERETEPPIELRAVQVTEAQPRRGAEDELLEILLRSGHALRIPARFEAGAVRTLVGILEAP